MKLAEALLERDELERELNLLQSRISGDLQGDRPTAHLQEEVQRKAIQLRDMSIAIAWTEQKSMFSGLPVGAYRIKVEHLIQLAQIMEKFNRERADFYWTTAHKENKVLENLFWLVDLQIPGSEKDKKEEN